MSPRDWINKIPAPDQNTQAGRAVMTAGHHHDRITHLQDALLLAGAFIGNRRARKVIGAANLGIGVGIVAASISHNRALCEACIADMPLNGAQEAGTHSTDLEAFHFIADHRWARVGLSALPWATVPLRRFGRAGVVADIVFGIAVMSSWRHVSATHHRLEPWCPKCRKGDDDEHVPEPVGGPAVSL